MLKGENKNFFYFALFIFTLCVCVYPVTNASMKFLTNKFPIIFLYTRWVSHTKKKKKRNNNNNNDYYYYYSSSNTTAYIQD